MGSAAAGHASGAIGGAFSPSRPPRKLASLALSKIAGGAVRLRRPLLRAAAVLSLVIIGFSRSAVAGSGATLAADAPSKPSLCRNIVKLFVTAAAVAGGASVANRMRSPGGDGDGAGDDGADRDGEKFAADAREDAGVSVVPKDEPSPLPLGTEWIEEQLKIAEEQKRSEGSARSAASPAGGRGPAAKASFTRPRPTPTANEEEDLPVTDLDSKIEMLRAREESAKADAEAKRVRDVERAAEARRQEKREIDAKIAAFEQQQRFEEERLEGIRREKAERERVAREKELAKLERGKGVQESLERAKQKSSKSEVMENLNMASGNGGGGKDQRTDVERARQQPKSAEEERRLKEKYGDMGLEERAFNILVDLGMVELHSDPGPLSSDSDGIDDIDDNNVFM